MFPHRTHTSQHTQAISKFSWAALQMCLLFSLKDLYSLWAGKSSLEFPPPLDTLESSLEMDTCCAASSGKRHRLHLGRHTVQAGGFTESWSQLLARWNKADNSLHMRLSLPMPWHSLSTSSFVFAFIFRRVTAQHIFWRFAYDKYTFHRAGLTLLEWCAKVFIYNLRTRVLISCSFVVTFKCTRQPWWPFGPQLQSWVTLVTVLALAAKPSRWKAATALATPAYELFPIESNLMLGWSKSKIYAAQEIP